MLIDWVTVAAQAANFLILVWLLKKFLYRPILRAMDEREGQIARRLRDAEEQKNKAREKAQSLTRQQSEIEARRSDMLAQARDDAERLRKELTTSAHREVEEAKKAWLTNVERERAAFLKELSLRAGRGALAVARRALEDLAGVDLEARVVEAALKRLREDRAVLEQLRASASHGRSPVIVLTALAISRESRDKLAHFLLKELDGRSEIQFELDPEMIIGLRVKCGGREVALDVAGYLAELEEEFELAIEAELKEKSEIG